jgi:Fe-Mn family superoxide dismutase
MELPYGKDEFAPIFTAETFDYHHGKHLNAYVTNANKLSEGTEFENMPLEEIIMKSDGGLYNNVAQIFNHEFFFSEIKPGGSGEPTGDLADAINEAFGSFEEFKKEFAAKAATLFGSGWAWLVKNEEGKLEIKQFINADTPLRHGYKPLFTIDVWEHAYYVDYRNARPNFIEKFFEVVNWEFVASKL